MSDDKFVTKDSGARREYATGSVRDRQDGKGRFDLIPLEPLRRLAKLYERGAVKYGPNNWTKGQPLMASFYDSALRHLADLRAGEPTEDHCAAVLWNIIGFMWTLDEIKAGRLPKDLDDRPLPSPQYAAPPCVDEDLCVVGPVAVKYSDARADIEKPPEAQENPSFSLGGITYVVFKSRWDKGGCAWCGGRERAGNAYYHNACAARLTEKSAPAGLLAKFQRYLTPRPTSLIAGDVEPS